MRARWWRTWDGNTVGVFPDAKAECTVVKCTGTDAVSECVVECVVEDTWQSKWAVWLNTEKKGTYPSLTKA